MPPGDSADVIGVGAVGVDGKIAGSARMGRLRNERVKPEVLSQGVGLGRCRSRIRRDSRTRRGRRWRRRDWRGAAACVLQARPGLTVREFRKMLVRIPGTFRSGKGRPIRSSSMGTGCPTCILRQDRRRKRRSTGHLHDAQFGNLLAGQVHLVTRASSGSDGRW